MLCIPEILLVVGGIREKVKDYMGYQHLRKLNGFLNTTVNVSLKWGRTKEQKKAKLRHPFPLQTIRYKVVFSVKHFIWMSKSILFIKKDQTFSMDITTEGPQKTANNKRQQCCLILSGKLQSRSGRTVSAQLVQLL